MSEIFISYRRMDSGSVARRLGDTLSREFGTGSVFLDTDSIRTGANWQQSIEDALNNSKIILPILGPRWLFAQDEFGRRRIDQPDDWVRREIVISLECGRSILPVLVSGAARPTREALPEQLQPLTLIQDYELNEAYWERDSQELIRRIEALGIRRTGGKPTAADVVYPPPVDRSKPLQDADSEAFLSRFPDWRLVTRTSDSGQLATCFYRAFRFATFEDAMHFMSTATRFVSLTNHHPEWLNIWVNVQVWLTTWDIGHKPSFRDIRLAEYLEQLYRSYTVPATPDATS